MPEVVDSPDAAAPLYVDETEVARVALEDVWHRLAPVINEAKQLESKGRETPSVLAEPSAQAQMRWLRLFETKLGAVQAVYEAAKAGARGVSAEQMRSAAQTGDKLLEINSKLRTEIHQPA